MSEYVKKVEEIKEKFAEFQQNAEKGAQTKAAGKRARKNSQELRQMLKDYRSVSLEHDQ